MVGRAVSARVGSARSVGSAALPKEVIDRDPLPGLRSRSCAPAPRDTYLPDADLAGGGVDLQQVAGRQLRRRRRPGRRRRRLSEAASGRLARSEIGDPGRVVDLLDALDGLGQVDHHGGDRPHCSFDHRSKGPVEGEVDVALRGIVAFDIDADDVALGRRLERDQLFPNVEAAGMVLNSSRW